MTTTYCPACRQYVAPTRTQAEHNESRVHKANIREPERRVRGGFACDRLQYTQRPQLLTETQ